MPGHENSPTKAAARVSHTLQLPPGTTTATNLKGNCVAPAVVTRSRMVAALGRFIALPIGTGRVDEGGLFPLGLRRGHLLADMHHDARLCF